MSSPDKSVFRVIVFFICAYGLSWGVFWYSLQAGIEALAILGVWGPSLSAILLTALFLGTAGLGDLFKRLGRWKVGIWWYALVILGPIGVNALGVIAWNLISGSDAPYTVSFAPVASLVPVFIVSLLIPALGEELGWRGFALPRLQAAWGPLLAALTVGLAHAFWHLPTYWLGTGTHTVPLLWFIAWVVALSILFTWVLLHTRGSLLMAVLFHAFSNVSLNAVQVLPAEDTVPITTDLITQLTLPTELAGPYLSTLAIYWALALMIVAAGGLKPKGD